MTVTSSLTLSAALLAGGQGRRLGGRDKGLMAWRGEPVAAYMTRLLRSVAAPVMISCNRNQTEYSQWADLLVGDSEPGFPGPMAGILAALRVCRTTHLLVVPCDLPRLDEALIVALVAQSRRYPEELCLVRAGEHWQPLVCVIPRALIRSLEEAWSAGQRSPLRWMLGQPHQTLHVASDDSRLHNANQPDDWSIEE